MSAVLLLLLLLGFSSNLALQVESAIQGERYVTHASNGSPSSNRPPSRADPLNGLRKYRGGYDVSNKHYWASAAFTGAYGFAIGAAVLLVGTIVLVVYLVKKRNVKAVYGLPPSSRLMFLVAVVFITAVALVFCGMILAGNKSLHFEAEGVKSIVINAADRVTGTIYYVTSQISLVTMSLQPFNNKFVASERLLSTRDSLYAEALKIQRKVREKKQFIDLLLKSIDITVTALTSLTMVVLLVALSLMVVVKLEWRQSQCWRWLLLLTMLVLWLLTVFSWVAFGFSYMTYNIVQDTCSALEEFQQNPYDNSFGSFLPCVNLRSANESVRRMREDLSTAIIQANRNISRLHTQLNTGAEPIYVPQICNPFSGPPQFQLTRQCQSGSITIDHIPDVLKPFQCSEQDCVNGEGNRIPNAIYKTVLAYSSAAKTLINATPLLESLINCSFVVDAFRRVVDKKCAPIRRSIHLIWSGYLGLAATLVTLLLLYLLTEHK